MPKPDRVPEPEPEPGPDPGPRRSPGRPRGGDSTEVRARIVRAAIELIGRQGYRATSMAQIAKAAGISATGLVHHFPAKEELYAAVLRERDELDRIMFRPTEAVPWAALESVVSLASANAQRPEMVRLFASVAGEATEATHPGNTWLREHYEQIFGQLCSAMRADQQAGVARADMPVERIAREIAALMDGYQTQWLLDPSVDMAALLDERIAEIRAVWSVQS